MLVNKFFTKTSTPLAALATFNSSADDVGVGQNVAHNYSSFNATVYADVVGTVQIQCSNSSAFGTPIPVSAVTTLVAGTPLVFKVPVFAQYYRVQVINGASLQTSFSVMTSFSEN